MKTDTQLSMTTASADTRPAAAEAERAGYAGVWTTEVKHDPFIAVALAASATERIELGTAIAVTRQIAADLQAAASEPAP